MMSDRAFTHWRRAMEREHPTATIDSEVRNGRERSAVARVDGSAVSVWTPRGGYDIYRSEMKNVVILPPRPEDSQQQVDDHG